MEKMPTASLVIMASSAVAEAGSPEMHTLSVSSYTDVDQIASVVRTKPVSIANVCPHVNAVRMHYVMFAIINRYASVLQDTKEMAG